MITETVQRHMEMWISKAVELEKKIMDLPEGKLYSCRSGKVERGQLTVGCPFCGYRFAGS